MKSLLTRLIGFSAAAAIFISLAGCDGESGFTSESLAGDTDPYSYSLSSVATGAQGIYQIEMSIPLGESGQMDIGPESNDNYSLITFLDTASWKTVTLCNKPNCAHSDSTCNAYVPSSLSYREENGKMRWPNMNGMRSAGYLWLWESGLYLINPYGDVVSMNPDGTEHEKLLTIDSKYNILDGYLYGGKVYLHVRYLPPYDPNVEQEFSDEDYQIALLEVDLKNRTCTELFSFQNELETTLLGLYDNKAYYFYRSPNQLASASTQQEVDDEENGHDVRLYACDLATGERVMLREGLKSYELDDVILAQDSIYYHNRKDQALERLHLDSGEVETVLSDLGGYIDFFALNAFVDNKLFFVKDNYLADAFADPAPENESYYVDIDTHKAQKIGYYTESSDETRNILRSFTAVTEDFFIFAGGDSGNLIAVSKDDFYNNVQNLIPIE